MKIYLIRHGESQSNYDKKNGNHYFCGQMDVPLTEKGEQSVLIYKRILQIKRLIMYTFLI